MSRSVPVPTRNLTPMSPCQLLRCHQSRGNPAMDGSQRVPTRRRDPRGCWAGSCTPAAAPRGNGFTPSWTGAITRHPTAGERPKCISGMRSSRCLRPAAATGPFTTGTAKKKREPQGSPQSHSLELHGRVSQQKPVPRSEKKKKPKPQKTQPNPCAGAFSPARTRNSHLRLGGMGAGDAAHGGGGGPAGPEVGGGGTHTTAGDVASDSGGIARGMHRLKRAFVGILLDSRNYSSTGSPGLLDGDGASPTAG